MKNTASAHLDALRAFAALLVFSAHARGMFLTPIRPLLGLPNQSDVAAAMAAPTPAAAATLPHPAEMSLPPTTAHQAVMIFFVLSGLLVGGSVIRSARRGDFSWPDYLNHRLSRLWVPLIPALVAGGLLDFVTLHVFSGGALIYPRDFGALTFLGNIAFLQDLRVNHFGSNSPLWSLAFEWAYYLAFPIGLFALMRVRQSPVRAILYVIIFAGVAWIYSGRYVPPFFLVWLLGVAVTIIPAKMPERLLKWLLPAAVLVLLLSAYFILKSRLLMVPADLLLAIPVALLCWLILNAKAPANPVYARVSAFGARMSYTLYLTHFPALILLKACLAPAGIWPLDLPHMLAFTAILTLVLLYAYGMYLLFEAHTDAVRRFFSKSITG